MTSPLLWMSGVSIAARIVEGEIREGARPRYSHDGMLGGNMG